MNRGCKQLLAACAMVSLVFSVEEKGWTAGSGTAAFQFLNIPTGARATAMGQAFTSVPNDVQAIVYNPASLATLASSQASFQHLTYVSDITQDALVFGKAGREEHASWGVETNYLRVPGIERTVAIADGSGDGFTKTGDFSTYDMMLGASWATQVAEGFSVGSTFKLIRESLADASANAGAVDVGVLYQASNEHSWNAGASLLNFGTASKFADAAVKLPYTGRLGVSGQPFAQWLFALDFAERQDSSGEIDLGAEVTPKKFFSMRVGYRYLLTKQDLGGLSDFSAGFGLRFKRFSLDYAFVPLGDLGTTHRVSLNCRFPTHRD